jgi:hypothetical protein
MIFGRIGLGPELGHRFAVHPDPAFGNELFRGAARRDARGGDDFLQTF